jgi:hypothetical protein
MSNELVPLSIYFEGDSQRFRTYDEDAKLGIQRRQDDGTYAVWDLSNGSVSIQFKYGTGLTAALSSWFAMVKENGAAGLFYYDLYTDPTDVGLKYGDMEVYIRIMDGTVNKTVGPFPISVDKVA